MHTLTHIVYLSLKHFGNFPPIDIISTSETEQMENGFRMCIPNVIGV